MPPLVSAGPTLTAGLRATFADAWKPRYEGIRDRMSSVMDMDLPSDKLTEIYAYFESAPYPRRWDRGDTISSKAFKSRQFSVTNYDWARRVEWHENDREDDQTRSLYDQARAAGENFATLPERIFYQIIRGNVDADLLPAIPNAPDGAALYAASRFGVTGGNILTGSGVVNAGDIRADFFNSVELFRQFQDTESQPLWDMDFLNEGFVVTYNVANDQVFREAFIQGRTLQVVQNVAGSENVSGAAVTNIIRESGLSVELWPTPRLTDNDWYVFAKGSRHKAIFRQVRRPLRDAQATMDTSDSTRDTKEEYVQWDERAGYGVFLPYQTVKVDN